MNNKEISLLASKMASRFRDKDCDRAVGAMKDLSVVDKIALRLEIMRARRARSDEVSQFDASRSVGPEEALLRKLGVDLTRKHKVPEIDTILSKAEVPVAQRLSVKMFLELHGLL